MVDLAEIFSSKARIKVLRTLYYQQEPLPLRQIAYISETTLFSIQRALHQMVEEGLIVKKKQNQYRLFSLNRDHRHYHFLNQVFDAEREIPLLCCYDKKAASLLDFVCDARNLLKAAKAN